MSVAEALEIPGVVLGGVLGRGASAVVYLGTQERFGRKVAVKVLDVPQGLQQAERFFRAECQTLGRLTSHPNILTLLEAGFTSDGRPFLVSEFLPQGTLSGRMRREGLLRWQEVLDIGVQLAGALETTHLHGVAHGDLKPQNVLVGRMGQPVLSDFGIARFLAASNTSSLSVLTPLHAAPELFEGARPSALSDVYGLASTIFTLLDGESPVGEGDESPLVVVRRVSTGELRRLDESLAPQPLRELLERCLSTDPAERLQTALELGEELREIQGGANLPRTDLPVMTELSEVVIDLTDAPPAEVELTSPPVDIAAPPTEPSVAARGRRRHWVAAAIAGVGGIVVASVILAAGPGAERVESNRPTTTSTSTISATSTSAPATSAPADTSTTMTSDTVAPGETFGKAGVQSGIEVNPSGFVDTSEELATKLSEESLIFFPFVRDGATISDSPLFRLAFPGLPVRFDYKSYNAGGQFCTPFLTGPVTLTGIWERRVEWGTGEAWVTVAEMATPEDARRMFAAFSLDQGVVEGECSGIEDGSITDPEGFGVHHRAVPLEIAIPDGADYNTWADDDVAFDNAEVETGRGVILKSGNHLVSIVMGFDELTLPVDTVLAQTLTEILARL